jgi:hypothetical protein
MFRLFLLPFIFLLTCCPVVAQAGTGTPTTNPAPVTPPATTSNPDTTATHTGDGNPSLTLNNDHIYQASLAALTIAFVIAVLLENALAVIFNWRVFLAYFSLTGVKTIVMFVLALIVVRTFHLDVMASLIAAYTSPPAPAPALNPTSTVTSSVISALILAGGSSGVNKLMVALGFRKNAREEDVTPRPPADKVWVSVRVVKKKAVSDVYIHLNEIGPKDANSPSPIVGEVGLGKKRLYGLLFRDSNRFPQNGGYAVLPDKVYALTITAKDSAGQPLTAMQNDTFVFAAGAIIDFEVVL